MTDLLVVDDLALSYGPAEALRGVSLRVAAGEMVALIGANGAGKTSTLLAISGVLAPRRGRVTYDGQDVTGWRTSHLVERGLVLVPEGRAILARMSVEENLWLGGYRRRDRTALGSDIAAMYARFPILGQRRRALAGTLSGGEQQQLAIARGLLGRPRLLLLDEPSMGLAPLLVAEIFSIVERIRADGVTVLLVEQNARRALASADQAYVLELGKVVLHGPAATLAADPRVQQAYLGGTIATAPSGT